MFNSNEPIKVAHLQSCALVMEIVKNSFSESKKNFSRLIKWKKF